MRKTFFALLLLALMPTLLSAQTVAQDDSYRTGKLKNGLTYYIRHNAKDPGLADFYIAQRMIERLTPTIYKGTKYEDCLPIGSMDIVDNFPYQDLRDYYQKWYRPDLQAITHDDYWDTIMYEKLRRGIDYHTRFLDILNSVTAHDVQQCAQDMLRANRRIEITQISE